MPFIGLITDWQQNDFYLGALKGCIYSRLPDANIIDINHTINQYNIFQAAFVLKACYTDFPEGTIFIIGVRSHADGPNGHMCLKFKNRYIISSDNGFFSLFTEDSFDAAIKLESSSTTFPEKDIFADCACKIALNESFENIGQAVTEYNIIKNFFPMLDKSLITGTVMYIDNYGNAITNISREQFERIRKNRDFIIYPGNNNFPIKEISVGYGGFDDAELIALFNSLNLLEIANINISASQFIKLEVKTNIRIQFYDTSNS
jgi:S-adenosyl-L-methionine hydrolase (adenosine-forming)